MSEPKRPGFAVFVCGRNGTLRVQPPRHQGASVRFTTCPCGAEFMAVQGQPTPCPRCRARTNDA